MLRYTFAPIAAVSLLAFAGSAQAANKTTTFAVTASVSANCFVSATDMEFGDYTGIEELPGTADVNVRCTNGWAYTLELSEGNGTYAERELSDGASGTLGYNLYTDAGHTDVWGDGTGSTSTVAGTGAGLSETKEITHTVYGLLPDSVANQDAPAGAYTDTITVTIVY